MYKYKVTTSVSGLPCIEVRDDPDAIEMLYACVNDPFMNSAAYKARIGSGAFIQSYQESKYILVEFWLPDYMKFINWLNEP